MYSNEIKGYRPLFELGVYEDTHPAVKVVDEADVCPAVLASFVTVLFETVMRSVPDNQQIEFEEKFNEALSVLMKERFDYDVTIKYPEDSDEDSDE
jgi:hypothetical protein